MSLSSLKSYDSFDWLFSEFWVSQSCSNMREFLIFSPFNIIFVTFIVIVVISGWSVSQLFSEFKFNFHLLSSWLSPSVIVLEEHIVQTLTILKLRVDLIHMGWDIALIINYTWSYLSNVHINHKTVVSINFKKFIFGQSFSLNIMLDIDVLVRKNNIWVSEFISWSFDVENFKVFRCFLGVIREEVVTVGSDLCESVVGKIISLFS